jgi:hypothetical protein
MLFEEPGSTEAYMVVITFLVTLNSSNNISNWVMAAIIGGFIPKFPSYMYRLYIVTTEN